ncbi:carbonic anhydrase 1 isoform X1 [Phascolarctos cinereus]|nr:carbonic anhydrase 1 isoform X2 [Phascolarctos cinereus]
MELGSTYKNHRLETQNIHRRAHISNIISHISYSCVGRRRRKRKDMASLNWSYEGENGPDHWSKLYPIANGNNQSPIDIKTKEIKHDASLKPFSVSYSPSTAKEIVNVGHSFAVNFEDKDNQSVLKGGPVAGSFRLRQFHFHWGTDDHGSEHTIDGVKYSAELHIVHWNSEKYASFSEAAQKPDGLVIIGVFMKLGQANPVLQKVIGALGSIKTKGKQAPFAHFDPSSLLPQSLDYWTYFGSLTHPPLYESVTWILLKEPISVSADQLAQFRSLLSNSEGEKASPILHNHRLPQPLKGRAVRASFQ